MMVDPKGMVVWSAQEAEIVTGGESSSAWSATGISMTLNELKAGDLFVASAEDDLDMVFQKGAAAIMMPRSGRAHSVLPVLKVAGIYEALKELARAARFRTHAIVLSVQGRVARDSIQNLLSKSGRVHSAGRHLSLDLAGLPVDVDYGVFGLSPVVAPDIAIITDCAMASRDTLFETMPSHGAVFVHAENEAAVSVVARAKAAGIERVYTYGVNADAQIVSILEADNGVRVCVSILEKEYTFLMPKGFEFDVSMLAALMVLEVTNKCLVSAMESLGAAQTMKSNTQGVMLIDPSQNRQEEAVFRITNMIDLGLGRQTAILDNISKTACKSLSVPLSAKKGFAIPARLDNLNFVYTSKGLGTFVNAKAVLKKRHRKSRVESIAPDALVPGDFLVFKDIWDSSKSALSDALRIIPETGKKPTHAL